MYAVSYNLGSYGMVTLSLKSRKFSTSEALTVEQTEALADWVEDEFERLERGEVSPIFTE